MSDLLDFKIFIGSLIRPLIKEAIADALQDKGVIQQPAAPADEILTVEQAAAFLNITTQTVYGLVSSNKIPHGKPTGSRVYFSRLALIEWATGNRRSISQANSRDSFLDTRISDSRLSVRAFTGLGQNNFSQFDTWREAIDKGLSRETLIKTTGIGLKTVREIESLFKKNNCVFPL